MFRGVPRRKTEARDFEQNQQNLLVFTVRIACELLARQRSETTLPRQKPPKQIKKNKGIEAPLQNEKLHPKMELSGAKIEAKIAPGGDLEPMQRAATGQAREATLHDGTWRFRNGQRRRKNEFRPQPGGCTPNALQKYAPPPLRT